jgi:O-acetyl-ADP-ribose deacetylase
MIPRLEAEFLGETRMATMAGRTLSIKMRETSLDLVEGEIVDLDVDVIVNPADEELRFEGPVATAIREKGGGAIAEECARIGGTPVGTAVMTGAGELAAKQVIHAVPPRKGEGEEDRKLAAAVRSSLALAERHGMRSIALPELSSGNSGMPLDRCARIMLTEIQRYIQGGTKLEQVTLCLAEAQEFDVFKRELRRGFR